MKEQKSSHKQEVKEVPKVQAGTQTIPIKHYESSKMKLRFKVIVKTHNSSGTELTLTSPYGDIRLTIKDASAGYFEVEKEYDLEFTKVS